MQTKNKTLYYLIGGGVVMIAATALFLVFFFQSAAGVSINPNEEHITIKESLYTGITSHKDFRGTLPELPAYGRANPFAPHF